MEAKFKAFDDAVEQDKPFVSRRLADEIEALGRSGKKGAAELLAARARTVDKVRKDVAELEELLHELRTDDGWKKSMDKKGITVHFKKKDDSPFLMTKAAKRFPPLAGESLSFSFVALVSMFAEVELMPRYFPRGLMKSHETLATPTKWSRYTHMKIQLPPFVPISPREAVIKGKGYDMTEESAICIAFRSLPPDYEADPEDNFTMPEPHKRYTRMEIQGAYYFELLPDRSVLLMNVQLLDLKLPIVPPFVINALAKGALPKEFFDSLDKTFRKYRGSEWEKCVRDKPETYEEARTRLEKHLVEVGIANEASSAAHSERDTSASTAAEADDDDDDDNGDDHDGGDAEPGFVHNAVKTVLSLVLDEDRAEEYAKSAASALDFGGGNKPAARGGARRASLPQRLSARLSQRLHLGGGGGGSSKAGKKPKGKLVKTKRGFSLRKKKAPLTVRTVSDSDL